MTKNSIHARIDPRKVSAVSAALVMLGAAAAVHAVPPRTEGGVTYVSGGIGEGERADMKAMARDYNLLLTFARPVGNYLADVKVTILDAQGNKLVETVSDGPWFYAKLPPGKYTVSAEEGGKVQTRRVNVGSHSRAPLYFYWQGDT